MTIDEMICITMTYIQTIGNYYLKKGLPPLLDLVPEELHSKINFFFLEDTQSKMVNTMTISIHMICKQTRGISSKTRDISLVSGLITQWYCMEIVYMFLEVRTELRDLENFINVLFSKTSNGNLSKRRVNLSLLIDLVTVQLSLIIR